MGLDVVDLFFNLNLPGFQSFLPGFQSFKYGDHFIEFFVRSHNSFLFSCIQIPNAWVFTPYDIPNFTLDQLLGTNQGGLLTVAIIARAFAPGENDCTGFVHFSVNAGQGARAQK